MVTTEYSETTVYCEKVEVPIYPMASAKIAKCSYRERGRTKWRISFPLHLNRVVPSGITPFPCVILTTSRSAPLSITCIARTFPA